MLTRSATVMIATFFALSGALAHAKVSPALETRGQSRDQLLQQLIDLPQGNEICDVGQWGFGGVGGLESIGTVEAGATLTSKLGDACPLPAPLPGPFDNVASL